MRRSVQAAAVGVALLTGFTCPDDRRLVAIEFLPSASHVYLELNESRAVALVRRAVYESGDTASLLVLAVARDRRNPLFSSALRSASFTFVSSDTTVATVSPTGFLRTRGVGDARILSAYDGFTDTLRIAVVPRVAELRIAVSPSILRVGQTGLATATAFDSTGAPLPRTYAAVYSEDYDVAEALDGRFTVLGRKVGTAPIVAQFAGQDVRARTIVSVIP